MEKDAKDQGKILIVTTEMGQLVTESCEDLKLEFVQLEKDIKINLLERQKDFRKVLDLLKIYSQRITTLGVADTEKLKLKDAQSKSFTNVDLVEELELVEQILDTVKNSAGVDR